MQRYVYDAIALFMLVFAAGADSACYEIYRNDSIVYRSPVAPVDMSRPFSETVPAEFGDGATMIYQERSITCDALDARLNSSGSGSVIGKQSNQNRAITSTSSQSATTAPLALSTTASWETSYFANEYSGSGGTSSGGLAGPIYTGPRGGQYYINSNGNKTYVSSGGSSRSGRR